MTHPPDVLATAAEFTLLDEALSGPHHHLFVEPDQADSTLDLLGRHHARVRILGRYWTPVLDELERRHALGTDVPRSKLFQWIMFVHSTLLTRAGRIGIGGEQVTVEVLRQNFVPAVVAREPVEDQTASVER